uniref:TNase-like domain-containing protein n=1 Tax=Lactuca sativa TaxID=4236 RepID=A0A9R1XEX9_LACSA|nr:hypothetical protein LSAT_V11C400184580 [Lactuca sativa]
MKVLVADGSVAPAGPADSRVMGFGSVFLLTPGKETEDVSSATPTPIPAITPATTQQPGVNVGNEIVTHGWAKERLVKEGKGEVTPEHTELLRLEEQDRQQGFGLWDRSSGVVEAAIRNLPPSTVGDPSNLDAMGLLASKKANPWKPLHRRTTQEPAIPIEVPSKETNGENNNSESCGPLILAQRISASSSFNEVSPDPYGREGKHFTEIRVLNRDFSNLIGSVYYSDGESTKDLEMKLIENGYGKYVEWSATQRKLKVVELLAKKTKLRLWTNYVPPATNSKAISDDFTGKVVEVVSGDYIVVADDSLPFGSPAAERRVNLSSIRCPKLGGMLGFMFTI